MELVPRSKIKVASQACNACKKRKIKCTGNPCTYCIKKNYICEFNLGKKRGPAKKFKFPKGVEECGSISGVLLNHIQSSLDKTYRQNNFVDFYFQYLGRAIPKEFKSPLMNCSEELGSGNDDMLAQLYIISAHVMQFFGNADVEKQCLEKANRHAPSIFNCDKLQSAITLMMMASYHGYGNSKFRNYMDIALNVTKLPLIGDSVEAMKAHYSCQSQLIFTDSSISNLEKYGRVIDIMKNGSYKLSAHVSNMDWTSMLLIILRHKMMQLEVFDDMHTDVLINSLNSPPKVLSAADLSELMDLLQQLDNVTEGIESSTSNYVFGRFAALGSRFLINWRTGNSQEAHAAALRACEYYKENKQILGLWNYNSAYGLAILPFYFNSIGMPEKAKEMLSYYEQSLPKKHNFAAVWDEICIKTGLRSISDDQLIMEDSPPSSASSSTPSSPSLSSSSTSPVPSPYHSPSSPALTSVSPSLSSVSPFSSISPPSSSGFSSISPASFTQQMIDADPQTFFQTLSQSITNAPPPVFYNTYNNNNIDNNNYNSAIEQAMEATIFTFDNNTTNYNTNNLNNNNLNNNNNSNNNLNTNLNNNLNNSDMLLFDNDSLSELLFSNNTELVNDSLLDQVLY